MFIKKRNPNRDVAVLQTLSTVVEKVTDLFHFAEAFYHNTIAQGILFKASKRKETRIGLAEVKCFPIIMKLEQRLHTPIIIKPTVNSCDAPSSL